jgi:hypothetical protein
MSDQTIKAIHDAIQTHIDSFEGPDEQLVDFVIGYATLNDKGGWCYSYTCSSMISPHGTQGLLANTVLQVDNDLFPDDAE